AVRSNRPGGGLGGLVLGAAGSLAVGLAFGAMLLRLPDPQGHAYAATLFVLGAYVLFHAALTGLMQVFMIARMRWGFVSARRRAGLFIVRLWADYLAVIAILGLLAAHLPGVSA
ncbi:MAG: cytochrome ubiquinol oxidase subunit I, partial [Alterinioella nitratireducens]